MLVFFVLFRLIVFYLYDIVSCYLRLIYCLHGEFHIVSSRHSLDLHTDLYQRRTSKSAAMICLRHNSNTRLKHETPH